MAQKGFSRILYEKINALAELERLNWKYEPSGSNEVKIRCPFPGHLDTNPSASLNTEKNEWKCFASGCNGHGSIVTLISLILHLDRKTVVLDLATRYNLEVVKRISPELIEKYHQAIWKSGPLLQELEKRCIGKDLIRKARLGYDKGKITIPIFDVDGQAINLRRYLPGAPTKKYTHSRGFKTTALYMPEQLKYDTIWICGGELKALAISPLLNKLNIGSVAVTGGEGTWNKELTKLITDKVVYLVMDIDNSGTKAALSVASQIKGSTTDLKIITLPLDKEKFPKGDINDWLYNYNPTEDDIQIVIDGAKRFEFPTEFVTNENSNKELLETTLNNSTDPSNIGKALRMNGIISGIDMIPFMLPKEVNVFCSQDQPNCHKCPIRSYQFGDEGIKVKISDDSYGMLEILDVVKDKQHKPIMRALNIPACASVEFKVSSYYSAFDSRLTPQLSLRNGTTQDYRVQPGLIVTTNLIELNVPYRLEGRVYPNPKTQQASLIINKLTPTSDSLNSCVITSRELSSLKIFQPKEWTKEEIGNKLDELYSDLEANVTCIYKRRNLHLALDLAWCSPLYFNFDDRQQNGWLNLLVIGDSAQGKTETSMRLMEHYGLGIKHDCKNASVAGLLGGVEQHNQRRFISWGVIPNNDRKLVVLEEIKGASQEVINQLTDMRSSGMAEITKIEKRKAHARTRLIMISNPRSEHPIASYNFGVEAIRELIGAPEDVRRYDLAVILSNNDIPAEELNKLSSFRPKVIHKFTNELCKLNILWAWTRSKDQIFFEKSAMDLCVSSAIKLCSMFSEDIPLIDRATTKFKIAKLSIALAIKTFSTNASFDTVIVRKCHIEYVVNFLIDMYTSNSFGYSNFTQAIKFQNSIIDTEEITTQILETLYPKDFIKHLLNKQEISITDIGDWCGMDREATRVLLSFFVRKHALRREQRMYIKTVGFIELLKRISIEKKDQLDNKVEIEL